MLKSIKTVLTLATLGTMALAGIARADVKLPPVISSHMVLQRQIAVPVWGTAGPDEKVTVKFRDQEKSTTADKDGKWMIKLDALQAGGPDTLTIRGVNTITLDDVLVGEVWVGSGQSNMATTAAGYAEHGDTVLAKFIGETHPKLRLITSGNKGWVEATPENNRKFSALLFSFGVHIQQDQDVPVGLLVGSVGGTPSGYWLSEEAYKADEACKQVIAKFAETYSLEQQQAKYQKELAGWEQAVAKAKASGAKEPRKPAEPSKPGDCRGKVGNLYERHIRPYIPFAIRGVLWDQGESGTAITGVDQYSLMGALIRGWRNEWGQGEFPFIYVQKPSGGGCAWDAAQPMNRLADKFAPLPAQVPADGLYRETHIKIMTYPNTAMVISSDLGHGIHPSNKSGYGERASQVARGMVYGKKIEYYGPVYQSCKIEGDKIRLTFTHVGQGLAFKNGEKLQGFAIAGQDKKFTWADAQIDGETIVVSSKEVPQPAAVRYAWANNHPWANLFNKEGLPALPFRTDSW